MMHTEMRVAIDFGSGALKIQMNKVDVRDDRILGEPLIAKFTGVDLTEDVAAHGGSISEKVADNALNILRAYKEEAIAAAAGLDVKFVAIATAVFRKAHNGPALLKRFEHELGIHFQVLSQQQEAELGFATGKALWPDVSEESLLVWDSGNGSFQFSDKHHVFLGQLGHGTVRILLSKDMRHGPVLQSKEFGNPISRAEALELADRIRHLLPVAPQWFCDKVKAKETKIVSYGDGESIFALVAQAINFLAGDKTVVSSRYISLSEVLTVMDAFMGKSDNVFNDAGLHGKTLTSAIHLHAVMKHFKIDEIEYKKSIGNAPGMLTTVL